MSLEYPALATVPELLPVLSNEQLSYYQNKLSDISLSNSKVSEYMAKKTNILVIIEELSKKSYNIDYNLNKELDDINNQLATLREKYTEIKSMIASYQASIENIDKRIDEYNAKIERINKEESELNNITFDYQAWDYIAKMLNPNKIPALELEMMLNSIDSEATRIISSYQEARFGFETKTQAENGTDKFDILVYDSLTGDKRSFMKYSPGQKAFFTDAYTKALVRERNSNGVRVYSPVIMDESDGPLQPELVGDYYKIQAEYWNLPVLIVSHSPASHEYIENRVEIRDLIS